MSTPHLNYHHLRLFWEVARCGSLRGAAERLHLSIPTISTQIKRLEVALGTKLFDRSGRSLRLSAMGKRVLEGANEIFNLGTKMVRSIQEFENPQVMRLHIGITDSLPKLMVWQVIRPALKAFPDLQLSCLEGRAEDLLGSLAAGRLEAVLADEPAPTSLPVRAFNHRLGESAVVFCAVPSLAKRMARGFPGSLANEPALLPTTRTAWRRSLDRWFNSIRVHPKVAAEFDDAAMMKIAAAEGFGYVPVAAVVLPEAVQRYGLQAIGSPSHCGIECYLITLERSMNHAAIAPIADSAKGVFRRQSTGPRPRSTG